MSSRSEPKNSCSAARSWARSVTTKPLSASVAIDSRSSGELVAIMNDDINQLERFLDHGANELLQLITTVLAVGGAMLWLSPTVAGVSFLPIPVILWGSLHFQRRLQPRYREVRERAGDLASRLAKQSSTLYATNLFRLTEELCKAKDGAINVNMEDDAIRGLTVIKDGTVTWPPPPLRSVNAMPRPRTFGPA